MLWCRRRMDMMYVALEKCWARNRATRECYVATSLSAEAHSVIKRPTTSAVRCDDNEHNVSIASKRS